MLLICVSLAGCVTDVTVITNPSDAMIYCNSEFIGKSPCSVPAPAKTDDGMIGMNVIEARKPGYMPEYYYLSGSDSGLPEKAKITITLTKLAGEVNLPELAEADNLLAPSVTGPYMGLISIEARVYRVKDLRCIGQASMYSNTSDTTRIAGNLATELAAILPKDKTISVRVGSFRNRRMTTFGQSMVEKLTDNLMRELCYCGHLPNVETIELRKSFAEKDLDAESTLKKMKKQGKLFLADYIIIGGLAECVKP